jgi:hypothetical protein
MIHSIRMSPFKLQYVHAILRTVFALVERWSWSTKLQLQNLVPIWALGTNLVPKAHVGIKFCNCSLVFQVPLFYLCCN